MPRRRNNKQIEHVARECGMSEDEAARTLAEHAIPAHRFREIGTATYRQITGS